MANTDSAPDRVCLLVQRPETFATQRRLGRDFSCVVRPWEPSLTLLACPGVVLRLYRLVRNFIDVLERRHLTALISSVWLPCSILRCIMVG